MTHSLRRAPRGASALATLATSALLLSACTPPKPPSAFEQDFDERMKSWTEIEAQLPPAPNPADLVDFGVSGATSYRFSIDLKSITIGSDDVFRYTLVATSPQGARNVSYEGIRCDVQQQKLYATGRDDGSWVRSRTSAWRPIAEVGNNRQQAALMKEYFCPDGTATQRLPGVIERLKSRGTSTVL